MTFKRALPFVFLYAFFLLPLTAYSAVSVESGFQGTLVITSPEGEINLYEPGDALPEIQPGSTLEVFDGSFTVAIGASDKVQLACLEHEIAGADASFKLACGETSGTLTAVKGTATVTKPDGTQATVKEGESYNITPAAAEEAPATAEGDTLGTEAGNDLPEVDPTSVSNSPS